jgi:integrase
LPRRRRSRRLLGTWDDATLGFDAIDRAEKLIVQFAIGTGLREGEQWCLHLTDVHADDAAQPHVVVRFGSWDPKRERYRSPKGRKGEKKPPIVPLFGIALDATRAWLAMLSTYAPQNPLGLMFPTERGARRTRPPRSWERVVKSFGVVPRVGEPIWWHLLRHTCASSLVSGWWGMR